MLHRRRTIRNRFEPLQLRCLEPIFETSDDFSVDDEMMDRFEPLQLRSLEPVLETSDDFSVDDEMMDAYSEDAMENLYGRMAADDEMTDACWEDAVENLCRCNTVHTALETPFLHLCMRKVEQTVSQVADARWMACEQKAGFCAKTSEGMLPEKPSLPRAYSCESSEDGRTARTYESFDVCARDSRATYDGLSPSAEDEASVLRHLPASAVSRSRIQFLGNALNRVKISVMWLSLGLLFLCQPMATCTVAFVRPVWPVACSPLSSRLINRIAQSTWHHAYSRTAKYSLFCSHPDSADHEPELSDEMWKFNERIYSELRGIFAIAHEAPVVDSKRGGFEPFNYVAPGLLHRQKGQTLLPSPTLSAQDVISVILSAMKTNRNFGCRVYLRFSSEVNKHSSLKTAEDLKQTLEMSDDLQVLVFISSVCRRMQDSCDYLFPRYCWAISALFRSQHRRLKSVEMMKGRWQFK